MNEYPFTTTEALSVIGIYPDVTKGDFKMKCPFCGSQKVQKKMYINLDKNIYRCWNESCPAKSGNIVDFVAKYMGVEWKAAYREIMNSLNKQSSSNYPTPTVRVIEKKEENKEIEIVDAKTRNIIYSSLLSNKRCKLTEKHIKSLMARGLSEDDAKAMYASVPNSDNYANIAICEEIRKETGLELKGVPGFYETPKGKDCLVFLKPGILIPICDFHKQIVGIHLRKDNDVLETYEDGSTEGKCSWVTSVGKKNGCKAHTYIHYACDFIYSEERQAFIPYIPNNIICLIEGPMKADIFFKLSGQPAIAVSGVGCIQYLAEELRKIKTLSDQPFTVVNCYDMDYLTKSSVATAMKKTEEIIKAEGMNYVRCNWNTKINGKDLLKGIDDFYAYTVKGIVPVLK